jgi:anti-sigma factor RsiW
MECLDTETLCMHIDNELEVQRRHEVMRHLSTCQRCTDTLRSLQEHDVLLRGVPPRLQVSRTSERSCYSAEELSNYSSGLLTRAEMPAFEQHLLACDRCLEDVMGIRRMQRLLNEEALLAPPAHLVAAVQQRAAAAPQSLGMQLGTLIIQVAKDGLKFLEALLIPEDVRVAIGGRLIPAGAFRSAQSTSDRAAGVDIQQTVRDLELHVQVLYESGETVLLKVRVQKHGTPLARVRLTLTASGRTVASRPTSASGEIEFPRLTPGEYTLKIAQEHIETQIILQAAAL